MAETQSNLNMDGIRDVADDCVTNINSTVVSHKSTGITQWNSDKTAHTSRFNTLDSKVVTLNE